MIRPLPICSCRSGRKGVSVLIDTATVGPVHCSICGHKLKPGSASSEDGIGAGCRDKYKLGTKAIRAEQSALAITKAHKEGRTFWDVLPEVEAQAVATINKRRLEAELKLAQRKQKQKDAEVRKAQRAADKAQVKIDTITAKKDGANAEKAGTQAGGQAPGADGLPGV